MPNTTNDVNNSQPNTVSKWLLLVAGSFLFLTQSNANEVITQKSITNQYTISHGVLRKDLTDERRRKVIELNKHSTKPDQLNGKASAKTREMMISHQKKSLLNSNKMLKSPKMNRNSYADFSIYGASSFLQDDFDGDGFYQTFSVVFDADIYSYSSSQLSDVYAILYLSKNGGPWTHYYTTDSFIIEGDTDIDEYEVITTILSGYSTDYYDVLIDLYEVGYSDIVASYSSDDSNALYALTLESADYDEPYIDEPYVEVVEIHGGAIFWLLMITLGMFLIRIKSRS